MKKKKNFLQIPLKTIDKAKVLAIIILAVSESEC